MLKAIHLYINKVSIRGQFPWYLCNTRRHYLWHSPDEAPGSIRDEMAVLMTLQALWQAETCLKDMDIGKSVKNFACKENKQLNDKSLLWNTVTISHIPACHFATSVNSNTFECIPMPVQMAVLQFASEFLDATFWRMWQTAWHCSVSRVAFFSWRLKRIANARLQHRIFFNAAALVHNLPNNGFMKNNTFRFRPSQRSHLQEQCSKHKWVVERCFSNGCAHAIVDTMARVWQLEACVGLDGWSDTSRLTILPRKLATIHNTFLLQHASHWCTHKGDTRPTSQLCTSLKLSG